MRNYPIETKEVGDLTVEVDFDDDPVNPRVEYDTVGTFYHWHRRDDIGDVFVDTSDFSSMEDLVRYLREEEGMAVLVPVYLYEHSGQTINTTGFYCPWDSGQVGWIGCTEEQVQEEWKGDAEKAREYLVGEIEDYDRYLRGDSYMAIVREADGEIIFVYSGFDDVDDALNEGALEAEALIKQRARKGELAIPFGFPA